MKVLHNKIAAEVEEELRFHIEMLELKNARQGMSSAEAKAAAIKRFGNLERIKNQCVEISRRKSFLRRVLKASTIPLGLTGLLVRILSSDLTVARIGTTLIMVAIFLRLLLHARGLSPATFLPKTKDTSLSLITEKHECS
jgi:hypothetical protein